MGAKIKGGVKRLMGEMVKKGWGKRSRRKSQRGKVKEERLRRERGKAEVEVEAEVEIDLKGFPVY